MEGEENDNNEENNNNEDHISINSIKENKKEKTLLLYNDNTNIALYELHPPEKISADYKPAINTNDKTKDKKSGLKMEEENDVIDYDNKTSLNTSRVSNKTQEITAFDVDEEGSPLKKINNTFGVAITGPVFEKLYKLNQKYMKTKEKELKSIHESYRQVLKSGRVFARMAPEHKALLVEA